MPKSRWETDHAECEKRIVANRKHIVEQDRLLAKALRVLPGGELARRIAEVLGREG